MTAKDIIEDSLQVSLYDETTPTDFWGKLFDFRKKPSDSQLKSRAITYLTNRIMIEQNKRMEAEEKEDRTIRKAIYIMEQYSPEATNKLKNLITSPSNK